MNIYINIKPLKTKTNYVSFFTIIFLKSWVVGRNHKIFKILLE